MKKMSVAFALLASLTLVGCTNSDIYSGSVYTAEQAKEARSIAYGTILSVREVTIQSDGTNGVLGTVGGGVLGGVTGSTIGGGRGRDVATAVGAIAGAVLGNAAEQKMNQTTALELVIRKDDGQEMVVVQKAEAGFVPGRRVRLVGSNSNLNVSPL